MKNIISNYYAPVAFFAYNRPLHTEKTLTALSKCIDAEYTELFIFIDAPKKVEDIDNVNRVKEICYNKQWCYKVHITENTYNKWPLTLIEAVKDLCENYGKIIVIEDDVLVSPYFLDYMNKALEKYKNIEKVMEISGLCYPIKLGLNNNQDLEAFFTEETMTYGWGTWKRAWNLFEPDVDKLLSIFSDKEIRKKLELGGAINYYSMLLNIKNGKYPGWDIRWHASKRIHGGLTLCPTQSLTTNIGFDVSGQHCGISFNYFFKLKMKAVLQFPDKIEVNEFYQEELIKFLCKDNIVRYKFTRYVIKKIMPKIILKFIKKIIQKILQFKHFWYFKKYKNKNFIGN